MLLLVRTIQFLWWLLKTVVLSVIIAIIVSGGMIVINYFGTNEYGGLDFQMNLVTEMIGVWASSGVTVLVIDRIYANRDREKDKQRLRHDAATGDNDIALRAINAMRYEKILTGKRGILKHAYLRGAKLQGADMHGANLSGAVLHSANLEGANLMNSDLQNAKLGMANLKQAKLFGAYIVYAEIEGVDPVELSVIDRIAKGIDLALGVTSASNVLDALKESGQNLHRLKEVEKEFGIAIEEWERIKHDAKELGTKMKQSTSRRSVLMEENDDQIARIDERIAEAQVERTGIQEAIHNNEQMTRESVSLLLYGQTNPVTDIEKTILPDGKLFEAEMDLTYLKRYTDPKHECFAETLVKVNRIRKVMGYPTRSRFRSY